MLDKVEIDGRLYQFFEVGEILDQILSGSCLWRGGGEARAVTHLERGGEIVSEERLVRTRVLLQESNKPGQLCHCLVDTNTVL